MLSVGDKFPAFSLQGINNKNEFVRVEVGEDGPTLEHDWSVVYFYPKDFTFICPTEIAGMDVLTDPANVIGISGDNEFCKLAWKEDNLTIGGIKHTLAADCGLGLSHKLGIVNEDEGVAYRATFIFDKNLIGAAILTKAFWCPLVLESVAKINLALSGLSLIIFKKSSINSFTSF